MPLTVRPPGIAKWNVRTLELFGLSKKSHANAFSAVWLDFGQAVMHDAERRQNREKLDGERTVRAEQEAEEHRSDLTAFAHTLHKSLSAESGSDDASFHQELQRIISLDAPPNSSCKHQAAVYKQFRWMALLHEELFMPHEEDSRYKTFMKSSGMRENDCDRGFHSIDWRNTSKDGEVVDAWLEDWQHGVQRLRVLYRDKEETLQQPEQPDAHPTGAAQDLAVEHENGKVVALCMYVPVLPSGLPNSKKDPLAECFLRLDDDSHVLIKGQAVKMIPFVLTLPRFEMLRRFQKSATTVGNEGLQLTGVHGAGKSHTLEVLSSVLLHGGSCDLFFHRTPTDLLNRASRLQPMLKAVACCGGPLGTMLDSLDSGPKQSALIQHCVDGSMGVGSPSSALMSFMEEYDGFKENTDGETALFLLKALFSHMKSNVPEGQARVIIMDEVHELLRAVGKKVGRTMQWDEPCGALADSADTIASFLESWLEWKYGAGHRALRILSSSPHGARESVSGIQLHPRFELRPPRADHLGALLAVAPEYLLGTGRPPRATDKGRGEVQAEVQDAVAVCDILGSNMRYVANYAASVSEGNARPAAASAVLHEMLLVLEKRIKRVLSATPESTQLGQLGKKALNPAAGRPSSPLWESVLRDASLTVCLSQRIPYHRLIAGKTSILAACAALGSLASQGSAQSELAKALDHMTHQDIELQCAARVYLKLLTRQLAQLPGCKRPSDRPPTALDPSPANASPILSVGEKRLILDRVSDPAVDRMWSSAQSVGRSHFLMSNLTLQYSVLHEPIVSVCRKLFNKGETPGGDWQRATIQTVHQFPGTDMIELDRNGTTCVVRLYEVTASTIAQHAKSKRMLEYDDEDTNARGGSAHGVSQKKDKAHAEIESVWGDVLALCGTPRHTACVQRDGSVKMTHLPSLSQEAAVGDNPAGSLVSGTSLINTILCSLGVPLVVHRRIEVADGKITHLDLSVEHCDSLCRELFGPGQDGNDAQWGMEGVTDWQLQVVYVSDTPQADNEADLLKHQSLVSLPFVRYVFREQMQEVLPL